VSLLFGYFLPAATRTNASIDVSELFFECYRVPYLTYGIDSLYSYMYNKCSLEDGGIVVSCGNTGTYILPVAENRLIANECKR
jgi:actin-related protein 5